MKICALGGFSNAHLMRKGVCALMKRRYRKNANAFCAHLPFFPMRLLRKCAFYPVARRSQQAEETQNGSASHFFVETHDDEAKEQTKIPKTGE
jgi:hypothetical protein